MTKEELLNALQRVQENYFLGTAALEKFLMPEWERISNGAYLFLGTLPPLECPIPELRKKLQDPENRKVVFQQHEASLRRSFLREPYELVTRYCSTTKPKQTPKFRSWIHFEFAEAIRLSIAHGERLGTLVVDRALPNGTDIKWQDIHITSTTTEIPMTSQHAVYFFRDIEAFVKNDLD